MEHEDTEEAAVDPVPVPALSPKQQTESDRAIVIDVDGEAFELRADGSGGTDYLWLTGPNPGYGFGATPTRDWSLDDHRKNIRLFLAQVDPTAGYIEDT